MKKFLQNLLLVVALMLPWVTQAQSVVFTAPFHENFDSIAQGLAVPPNWSNAGGTASENNTWKISTGSHVNSSFGTSCHSAPKSMEFNCYSASRGQTGILKTPVFSLNGHFWVKFWLANMSSSTGNVSVYLSTDGGATYTDTLEENITNTSGWVEKIYDLQNYDQQSNLVLIWVATSDYGSYNIFLDDVAIELVPSCMYPNARTLAADSVTPTTAKLTWGHGGTESAWNVFASLTPVTDFSNVTAAAVTDTFYTATGLLPNTPYYFYVQAVCDSNDVSAWTEGTFRTACAMMNVSANPLREGFEGLSTNTIPSCWLRTDTYTSGSTVRPSTYTSNVYEGSNCMYFYTTSTYKSNVLASPELDSINTLRVNFYARYSTAPDVFVVGVLEGDTGFVAVDTIALTSTYELYEVFLNSYTGSGTRVAFKSYRNGYSYVYLDNVVVSPIPSCLSPINVTVPDSTITATTAAIGWTSRGMETSWRIIVSDTVVTNFDNMTGTPVAANPYTYTGLTPNTPYYVYVQANCGGGDLSEWSRVATFRTGCAPIANMATEGFEDYASYAVPFCWQQVETYTSGNNTYPCVYSVGHSGSRGVRLYTYATGNAYTNIIASPEFLNLNTLRVRFFAKTTAATYMPALFLVGVMQDDTNFVAIDTITLTTSWPSDPIEVRFGSYSGNASRFAFYSYSTSGTSYVDIDDVTVDAIPSCNNITGLNDSAVTENSAAIYWTAGGTETAWNLIVSDTAVTNFDSCEIMQVTENPFVVTGLNSNTLYYAYVQADCGTSVSPWSSANTFRTLCGTYAAPFHENFDSVEAGLTVPGCWSNAGGTASATNTWKVSTGSHVASPHSAFHSAPKSMEFNCYSASRGQTGVLMTPVFSLNGHYVAKFWLANMSSSTGSVNVYISTDGGATYADTLESNITNTNGWVEKEYDLQRYDMQNNLKLVWEATSDFGTYNIFIDDVSIELAPTCPRPSGVQTIDVGHNYADIAWTSGGSESLWNVIVSDSVITDYDNAPQLMLGASVPYTATGLTPSTTYYVYVQADCGNGDVSAWTRAITFTTTCAPVAAPIVENFATTAVNAMPTCWNKITTSTTDPQVVENTSSTTYAYTDSLCLRMYGNAPQVAIMPPVSDVLSTLRVNFFAKSYTSSSYIPSVFAVGVMEGDNFVGIDTITLTSSYAAYEVSLAPYHGSGKRVAFYANNGTSYYYVYLDSVVLQALPSCPAPVRVSASNITTTSADITWMVSDTNQAVWEVVVSDTNYLDTNTATTVYYQPYSLTNLTPNTTYYVMVRANCVGENSNWSSVYNFTTPCEQLHLPYRQNFESFATGTVPGCWFVGGTVSSTSNNWKVTTGTHVNSAYNAYHSASKAMEFNSFSVTRGQKGVLMTPVFSLNGHYVARFWLANMSSDTGSVSVYISTDGGVTYNNILEQRITNTSGWVEKEYDLINYDQQSNLRLVWVATSDYGSYNIFLDDLTIEPATSCAMPGDIVTTGSTSSSVSLQILDSVNTSGWELVYGPYGADPDSMSLTAQQLYDDTVTVTGLADTMYYDFYVRANCMDGSYSSWRGPVTVMPGLYVMGVTPVDTLRTCGTRIADNGGLMGDYSANAHDTVFIYPTSIDSLVRITGTINTQSNSDYLYVYDGIGAAATLIERYSGVATIDTFSTSGPMTLIFTSNASTQNAGLDLYASCLPAPSCADAQNLTVDNIAGASATVSWTYNSSNSTPSNYYLLVMDTVTGDTAYAGYVDTTVVNLVRLNPTTTYRVSVTTYCDNAEISEPVITYFTTPCLAGGDYVVGTGTTTTSSVPAYYSYNSSLSQQIFDAAEIQQDTILGLAFYATSDATAPYTFNIYLDTTSRSTYSAYANYITQDSTHRVFSATNYTFHEGWNEFRFATPYVKPAGNLIVTFEKTSGTSSSFSFRYTSTSGKVLYAYARDTMQNANAPMIYNSSLYAYAYTSSYRNNIKFLAPCINVTCVAPNVTLNATSATSATISWQPGFSETNWKVEYLAAGDSVWVVTDTNTTLMTTTINGLQPNHNYVVRVSSLCTDTAVSTLIPVHTDCAETTLPFAENFDSYTANTGVNTAGVTPGCWNIIYTGSNAGYAPHVYNGTYAPNSSNNALVITSGAETYGSDNYAVLPSIATNGNNVVISFAYRMESATNGTLTLGYMTNVSNASSFVGVRNFTNATAKVEAECELGSLPANARIAFRWSHTTSYWSCAIDDILVQRASSCGRAQRIRVDSTTTTSAYISFVDTNNAGDYTIFWSTTDDAATAVDSTSVMGSPCTLTNLVPSTTYYAWIRVNCTAEPSWLAAIPAFNTQCAPITVTSTNVYTQNFNAGVLPNCWSQTQVNYTNDWAFDYTGNYAHNSGNAAGFDETSGSVTKLVTCEFDFSQLDTNARVSFWHLQKPYSTSNATTDSLVLYYRTSSSATWTLAGTFGGEVSEWTKQEIVLPNSFGATTYQIAFEGICRGGDGVFIDDITVGRMSTCPMPSALAANYVGSDSVVLGWRGTNSSYIVAYREADSTTWQTVATTATLAYIGGLRPNTTYVVGVYGVCSGDTSYMSDLATFTTYCSAVAVPYTENFNGYTSGLYTGSWTNHPNMAMPTCWTTVNRSQDGSTAPYVAVANYNSRTIDSTNYLTAYSNYSTPLYMTLPLMDEPIDTLQIQFDYKLSSSSLTAVLGVMTRPADETSFIPIDTLEYSGNHVQHFFPLDNGLNANTNYYITIMVKGSGYYLSLDNVVVDYAPTCYAPTALTASAISTTTATLGWTSSATRFELNYRQQGSATTPWTSVAATTATASLTGLTASTTYEARVRAICSASDTSEWSTVFVFTTNCVAMSVPYSENFENYAGTTYSAAGVLPRCWDAYTNGTGAGYFPHVVDGTSGSYNYCHGSRSLVMTSGSGESYGSVKVVALPEFSTPMNQLKLKFWMSTESSSYGTLYVGYVTGSNFNTNFVAVKTIAASSATYHGSSSGSSASGVYDSVLFTNVPATATRIAFKWEYNSTYYSCCIDDIDVTMAPLPCNAPTVGTPTVTTNSATISWTGDGSSYELAYKESSASSWSNPVTVNAQTYTITGLNPNTNYAARVRQVCGTTTSNWATTTFTTDTIPYYTITVTANDTAMGTVTGGGRYIEGAQVTLTATANQGYHFVQWQDNDTNATRRITVTADASYTATFAQNAPDPEGIDDVTANMSVSIYPNPASGSTTINVTGAEGSVVITIVDMSGRQVKSETMECAGNCTKQVNVTGLSQGAYFVRISSDGYNMVKKLIVK